MSMELVETKHAMNRMYRLTRHIYDATRKFYLLGRDLLLEDLHPQENEIVLEIGCGTARNLIKMAQKYPSAKFYGIDASDEMLKTAWISILRKNVTGNVQISQGYGENYDLEQLFKISSKVDKVVFSYALSIIPSWKDCLERALSCLKPGGTIHIVDFGDLMGASKGFRNLLFWWLNLFGVHFKPSLLEMLENLPLKQPIHWGVGRYYFYGVIAKD